MATIENILSNKKPKGESPAFIPKKRRPWDYISVDDAIQNDTPKTKAHKDNSEKSEAKQFQHAKKRTESDSIENTIKGTKEDSIENTREHDSRTEGTIKNTKEGTIEGTKEHGKFDINKLEKEISSLSGVQKKIFHTLLELNSENTLSEIIFCRKNTLSELTNSNPGSIKNSINRLINKGLIIREAGVLARGGGINIRIPLEVKKALIAYQSTLEIQEKIKGKMLQKSILSVSQMGHDREHNMLYSSSINNITTTKSNTVLPKAWEKIDIALLEEIGFSTTQLKQLYQQSLKNPDISSESVQESIRHFAFGLEQKDGKSKYPQPLNVFMGVLRKGQSWIEAGYQSPQEIAQARLLEQKRLARERMKKMAEEAFNLAFDTWQDTLSKSQINELTQKRSREDITPAKVKLQSHFRENIWPGVKHEYLIENESV